MNRLPASRKTYPVVPRGVLSRNPAKHCCVAVTLMLVLAAPIATATAQGAPVAVVLNGEDGKSLGLAILQPADGVSLMLPASASVIRVAPGAAEVTSHAVRWSAGQVVGVDRLVVVIRVSGAPRAEQHVVVSNGTDVRSVVLSAAGNTEASPNRAVSPPAFTPASKIVEPHPIVGWLSVAASRFGGSPIPPSGPLIAAPAPIKHETPQSPPHTPSSPQPAIPQEPKAAERVPVFNLASRRQPTPGDGRPTPNSMATVGHAPIAMATHNASRERLKETTWHFASPLVHDSAKVSPASVVEENPTGVRTSVPTPVPQAATDSRPQAGVYSIGDLFTSTGFPAPTRITRVADDKTIADAWTESRQPAGPAPLSITVAATRTTGSNGANVTGGELSIGHPLNESVSLGVSIGALSAGSRPRDNQYATAGIRVAPNGAGRSSLSPFLSVALGVTKRSGFTGTRFAIGGGIQVPVGKRAMMEVGLQDFGGPQQGSTAMVHVGLRALFGMHS